MFQVVKKGSFEGFEAFFSTFQVHTVHPGRLTFKTIMEVDGSDDFPFQLGDFFG